MMNNIFSLLKVHFLGTMNINRAIHTKDSAERAKTIGMMALIIFSMFVFLAMIFFYCYSVGIQYHQMGLDTVLPAMTMGLSSILCLITSAYKGSSILFLSRDFNIILPLPIKSNQIITAKILILYITNLFFTLFIMVPACVVYAMLTPISPLFFVYALICTLLIPLLPILVGTAISIAISAVSTRFKAKNAVGTVLMLAFFAGVMFLSFSMGNVNSSQLAQMGQSLNGMLNRIYPLTQMFVEAVCNQNTLSFVAFVAIAILAFLLFIAMVGKKFTSIHTLLTTTNSKSNFKMAQLHVSGPLFALYKKELKRYFSCSIYVVNTIFGVVILLLLAGVSLFKGAEFLQTISAIPELLRYIPALIAVVICVMVAMTNTTSVSISLEGKSFPLTKSFPVGAMSIIMSKIFVNLSVTLPAILLSGVIFCIVFDFSVFYTVICFLLPVAYAIFAAIFGIIINLNFPNFEWSSEAAVVKQSLASFVGIFGGMIFSAVPAIILFITGFSNATLTLLIATAAVFVIDAALFLLIKSWGVKAFSRL